MGIFSGKKKIPFYTEKRSRVKGCFSKLKKYQKLKCRPYFLSKKDLFMTHRNYIR